MTDELRLAALKARRELEKAAEGLEMSDAYLFGQVDSLLERIDALIELAAGR